MKRFLLYMVMAVAVIGCTKDSEVASMSGDVLTISTDIATRADKTAWVGGESIGVYMSTVDATSLGDVGANIEYTTSSGSTLGTFTSTTPIYYPDEDVNILAYYPYADLADPAKYPIVLANKDDLLVAQNTTALTSSSGAVGMTFYHKLSRISISIEGDGITLDKLDGVKVEVVGLTSTADFIFSSSTVTNPQGSDNLELTTSKETEDTTIKSIEASGIVIPVEFKGGTITFTLNDMSVFTANFPDTDFESGIQYNYTANVGYDGVAITTSGITGWGDPITDSGTADIVDLELKGDTYYINSAKGLAAFRDLVNGSKNNSDAITYNVTFTESEQLGINGKLTRNIDLKDICNITDGSWSTIGYYTDANYYYKGTFDGGGYEISNLYISTTDGNMQSLFRGLDEGGVIHNLGVSGDVKNNGNGDKEAGGIVAHNYGTIINCYSSVTVDTTIYTAGGIAAYNTKNGKIINCYNLGKVTGTKNIGGIVGYNEEAYVGHCFNTGDLPEPSIGNSDTDNDVRVGGIVGYNTVVSDGDDPLVKGSFCLSTTTYTIGQVHATADSGGLRGNVCDETYLKSKSFVTTINNSCANYGYNLAVKPCGFAVADNGYATVDFGNEATFNFVDISYNSVGYNIYSGKGLLAFAALVNGSWAKNTDGITTSGADDSYFASSATTQPSIGGNLSATGTYISLSGVCDNWTPIGSSTTPYTGTFEGNSKEVQYLNISASTSDYQGLFGSVSGATISNLGVAGSVTGDGYVGGVVGSNSGATIINCYSSCVVSGSDHTGGVVGSNSGATIINCYNTGVVGGGDNTGGVVGSNDNSGYVVNCYNTSVVRGSDNTGGVVGSIDNNSYVVNCYNAGNVSGTVDGSGYIGGMVGSSTSGCSMINGYNRGSVSVGDSVGGVIGYNNGTITGCYFESGSASLCIGSSSGSASTNDFNYTTDITAGTLLGYMNTNATSYNTTTPAPTNKACKWIEGPDKYPTLDFDTEAGSTSN